eukprot:Em0403g3a
MLISGKVPVQVARFLAGGNLVALEKNKPNCPPDIQPIAVGEAIRRLAGKCLCSMTKAKAHDFLAPFQLGVACQGGAEKIIHGLRSCVDEHWHEAVLNACALHIPELLPWSQWCYGQHPALWHSLGTISSEIGVQQGPVAAIARVLAIIQESGPPLGLNINIAKCELFSSRDLSSFPEEMRRSNVPHFEILGAPIGDLVFCATFVAQKQSEASQLLKELELWVLSTPRNTPPLLVNEAFALFDDCVQQCFSECTAVDASAATWQRHKYISSSLQPLQQSSGPQDSITLSRRRFLLFHRRARLLSFLPLMPLPGCPVTPSSRLNLHLEPAEFQAALKWWLGIQWSKTKADLTVLPVCWMTLAITPSLANMEGMWFRDAISSGMCFMTSANALAWVHVWKWVVGQDPILNPALQMFMFPNWDLGKPAAFDLSVTSTLQSSALLEASVTAGSAALLAENRKHNSSDTKCDELGWACIPLVVETYGCWGDEAVAALSKLAGRLSVRNNDSLNKSPRPFLACTAA